MKKIFVILCVVCLLFSSCRQSRPSGATVTTISQQAVVTPIPTFTPTKLPVAQPRDSGRGVSKEEVGRSSAMPTPEQVPTPNATATATRQPRAIATRQPTAVPTPEYYVNSNANLRSGPGTDYSIVGGRKSNDVLSPIAITVDGEWIQIDKNVWIWSGLVEGDVENLPVTLVLVPTATHLPSPTFTPTPAPVQSPEIMQQSNSNDPDIICTTYYATQQAREDCWWRYHNGLPLLQVTPTLTPMPTPTQQSTLTYTGQDQFNCVSNDADYLNKVSKHVVDVTDISQTALDTLDLFQDNNYIVRDDNWIHTMGSIVADMDALANVRFDPPSLTMSNLYYQYHEVLLTFEDATHALQAGVKYRNFGALNKGDYLLGNTMKLLGITKRWLRIIC